MRLEIALLPIALFMSFTAPAPRSNALSDREKTDLILMREEEKLAYDLYRYAYAKYGYQVFDNISRAEEQHMSLMLSLINSYKLEDPVAGQPAGVFKNESLQFLYNELITKVDRSLADAMHAGATFEDIDLFDLREITANTTKPDLLNAYQLLICGSEHHLQAFTRQINNMGGSYQPQYISDQDYKEILQKEHKPCGY